MLSYISAFLLVHCSVWLLAPLVSSWRLWFQHHSESHWLSFWRFIIAFVRLPLDETDTFWAWLALWISERVVSQLEEDPVWKFQENWFFFFILSTEQNIKRRNFVWNGCIWSKIQAWEASWTTEMLVQQITGPLTNSYCDIGFYSEIYSTILAVSILEEFGLFDLK